MKRFYLLLGVVAAVAGVLIWRGSRPGAGATPAATDGPPIALTAADSAFKGYVLGSDSAPIEVTEYADFECPYCAQFAVVQFPEIRQQLIATGRLRWRYRDFPLPGHRWSRLSAHAVACASEQGKAWEGMDAVFQRHGDWAQQSRDPTGLFRDRMRALGLDLDRYDACMASQRYAGRIEVSRQEGDVRGVGGTPTFFVNGTALDNRRFANSDAFKDLVDSLTAGRR